MTFPFQGGGELGRIQRTYRNHFLLYLLAAKAAGKGPASARNPWCRDQLGSQTLPAQVNTRFIRSCLQTEIFKCFLLLLNKLAVWGELHYFVVQS